MSLRFILACIVALIIFWSLSKIIDWDLALDALLSADLKFALSGIILTTLIPFIGAARWKTILSALDCKISLHNALKAVMIAFSANIFAPAKSGDLIKVLVTDRYVSKTNLMAGVIAERLGDLLILAIFCSIGGLLIGMFLEASLGIFVLFSIILGVGLTSRLKTALKFSWLCKISQIVDKVIQIWCHRPMYMIQALSWSAVNWLIASAQIWLFFLAMGTEITLLTVISLFPLTVFITLLPITPGGIGVRESAFVVFFLPYAELHSSLVASLGYYICNIGLTGLLGVLFINSHMKNEADGNLLGILKGGNR